MFSAGDTIPRHMPAISWVRTAADQFEHERLKAPRFIAEVVDAIGKLLENKAGRLDCMLNEHVLQC